MEDWKIMLNEPLPGREKEGPSEVSAEIEGQDFMAMMAQHQANTAGAS